MPNDTFGFTLFDNTALSGWTYPAPSTAADMRAFDEADDDGTEERQRVDRGEQHGRDPQLSDTTGSPARHADGSQAVGVGVAELTGWSPGVATTLVVLVVAGAGVPL